MQGVLQDWRELIPGRQVPDGARSVLRLERPGALTRVGIVLGAMALIVSISVAECITVERISFGMFYLVPVGISAWYVGHRTGWWMALVAAVAWFVADRLTHQSYPSGLVPVWNALMRLGYFTATAYLLHRLHTALRHAKRLSRTDPLTGLLNGRAFFDFAAEELDRCTRYGHALSFAYLDVDDFKTINDRYGHTVGDEVLQLIAQALREHTRRSDLVGRVGGDEFAILLPETDAPGAIAAMEKLRQSIQSELPAGKGASVSIGLVTFPRPAVSVGEMTRIADRLMYRSKGAGKNSISHQIAAEQAELATS